MESYTLEDLFQSINDIYYQFDEGRISLSSANDLAAKCCSAFLLQNKGE
jgi:hypothetical protein